VIFGRRLKTSQADGWVRAVSEGVGEKRVPVRDPPVGPRVTSPTGPNRSPGPFLFFSSFLFFFFCFLFLLYLLHLLFKLIQTSF
jgi:hypothetical protein